MLIDFSVSNYRSFREKQVFSMEAALYLRKKDNVINVPVKGDKSLSLLKVAAIYGPNASGKSNLCLALSLIGRLMKNNLESGEDSLPVTPFRFDIHLLGKPSQFEINFVTAGKKYRFELALTSQRIISEVLSVFVKGKPQKLYARSFDGDKESYEIEPLLEGGELLHDAWKNLTSPKLLFLSQAVNNSSENLMQLRIPYAWLRANLTESPDKMQIFTKVLHLLHNEAPARQIPKEIALFLSEIDIPVAEVKFNNNSKFSDLKRTLDKDDENAAFERFLKNSDMLFRHKTMLGEAEFSLDEESEGTKNLTGFLLIWIALTMGAKLGVSAIFDELDTSLHPKIIERLVAKLHSLKANSQLIFTTHNTHLMDSKLMRRDQFWVAERDNNGATRLASIYDYEGREGEDVEKRYYEGRYRGLPNLKVTAD